MDTYQPSSRERQGLPATIEDPDVLAAVAAIVAPAEKAAVA